MKLEDQKVKDIVKKGYTKAIAGPRASGGGCCQSTTSPIQMKGHLAKMAGYSAQELELLPADAVENSFGCGNPLALAGVQAGQTVLDIGSGAGIDCFLAAAKVGPGGRVIGIDMTPAMIEKAKTNAARAGITHVDFRLGDADRMPVDDASVDWVISNCVINLAPDKDRVFSEIVRVLKPGGRVSISDIVVGGELPDAIADNIEALVGCLAGAIRETDYLRKMEKAGLSDVGVVDRLVYSGSQIETLFEGDGCGCCAGVPEDSTRSIEGTVWSAKIIARKPDAPGKENR